MLQQEEEFNNRKTSDMDAKDEDSTLGGTMSTTGLDGEVKVNMSFAHTIVEVCKVAPIRFSDSERQVWRILESALAVSEYTDKIDVLRGGSK